MIVMEDLGVHGYETITQPLQDYKVSKDVFERLAKFHATGFYLIKEKQMDYSRSLHNLQHGQIISRQILGRTN